MSFTEAQGIPKYMIGLGRGKDGRVGVELAGVTGLLIDVSCCVTQVCGPVPGLLGGRPDPCRGLWCD